MHQQNYISMEHQCLDKFGILNQFVLSTYAILHAREIKTSQIIQPTHHLCLTEICGTAWWIGCSKCGQPARAVSIKNTLGIVLFTNLGLVRSSLSITNIAFIGLLKMCLMYLRNPKLNWDVQSRHACIRMHTTQCVCCLKVFSLKSFGSTYNHGKNIVLQLGKGLGAHRMVNKLTPLECRNGRTYYCTDIVELCIVPRWYDIILQQQTSGLLEGRANQNVGNYT